EQNEKRQMHEIVRAHQPELVNPHSQRGPHDQRKQGEDRSDGLALALCHPVSELRRMWSLPFGRHPISSSVKIDNSGTVSCLPSPPPAQYRSTMLASNPYASGSIALRPSCC